jgi:hypothetical protein
LGVEANLGDNYACVGAESNIDIGRWYNVREIGEYGREETCNGAGTIHGLALGVNAVDLGHGKAELWHVNEHTGT